MNKNSRFCPYVAILINQQVEAFFKSLRYEWSLKVDQIERKDLFIISDGINTSFFEVSCNYYAYRRFHLEVENDWGERRADKNNRWM